MLALLFLPLVLASFLYQRDIVWPWLNLDHEMHGGHTVGHDPLYLKKAAFLSANIAIEEFTTDNQANLEKVIKEKGVKVVFGPGRHATSSAMFLYFEGPDKMVYEYSVGVKHIRPEDEAAYRPRQFPFTPESFCIWGARPDIPEFRAK